MLAGWFLGEGLCGKLLIFSKIASLKWKEKCKASPYQWFIKVVDLKVERKVLLCSTGFADYGQTMTFLLQSKRNSAALFQWIERLCLEDDVPFLHDSSEFLEFKTPPLKSFRI